MKKLAVLLVVCVLALIGCAQFKALLNSAPVDFVCAPDAAQQATATAMLAAIDAAQVAGAIFLPALAVAKASSVLKVIAAGGCFLVAELKTAFEVVDAGNAAQSAKAVRKLKMSPAALPEYKPLRDMVK